MKVKGNVMVSKKHKKWVIATVLIVLLVAILGGVFVCKTKLFPARQKPEIISTSDLYKIVGVNKLYTYQCVYNDVCTVKDDSEKDAYYVSYNATIQAGIDVKEIKISPEELNNGHVIVTIALPEIHLEEPTVDIKTLDYMFMDKSFETGTVTQEAYKACIADVKEKSQSEDTIYEMAAQSAKNSIQALVQPFLDATQDGKTYELKISVEGEDTNEEKN